MKENIKKLLKTFEDLSELFQSLSYSICNIKE
jgi:t-SNARE complex subunit (syntaxin)